MAILASQALVKLPSQCSDAAANSVSPTSVVACATTTIVRLGKGTKLLKNSLTLLRLSLRRTCMLEFKAVRHRQV